MISNQNFVGGHAKRPFIALFVLVLFAACGTTVPRHITLPDLEVAVKGGSSSRGSIPSEFFVEQFTDVRGEQALVTGEGNSSEATQNVAKFVSEGVRQALLRKNLVWSETAPLVIRGEIRNWQAQVKGGFPASIGAKASIYIEVLDPSNKAIYAGEYRGFSRMETAGVDEDEAGKVLSASMAEAIRQLTVDKRLFDVLSSF